MTNVVVVYATREGQTRRIAARIATVLRSRGHGVDLFEAAHVPPDLDLPRYDGAILAASIHIGKHGREMCEFARANRAALERMPTLFLSVSMAAAGAADASATAERRRSAAANRDAMIARFARDTGFHATRSEAVAGALLYRQYNFLVRAMMRFIASVAGASTDTSRDHEYTDWNAVERYAAEFAALLARKEGAGQPRQSACGRTPFT